MIPYAELHEALRRHRSRAAGGSPPPPSSPSARMVAQKPVAAAAADGFERDRTQIVNPNQIVESTKARGGGALELDVDAADAIDIDEQELK